MAWLLSVGISALAAAPFYALARWERPPTARGEALRSAALVFGLMFTLSAINNLAA